MKSEIRETVRGQSVRLKVRYIYTYILRENWSIVLYCHWNFNSSRRGLLFMLQQAQGNVRMDVKRSVITSWSSAFIVMDLCCAEENTHKIKHTVFAVWHIKVALQCKAIPRGINSWNVSRGAKHTSPNPICYGRYNWHKHGYLHSGNVITYDII